MHVSVSITSPRNIQSCNVLSSFQVMWSGNLSNGSIICESLQNTTTIDKNNWIINISSMPLTNPGNPIVQEIESSPGHAYLLKEFKDAVITTTALYY